MITWLIWEIWFDFILQRIIWIFPMSVHRTWKKIKIPSLGRAKYILLSLHFFHTAKRGAKSVRVVSLKVRKWATKKQIKHDFLIATCSAFTQCIIRRMKCCLKHSAIYQITFNNNSKLKRLYKIPSQRAESKSACNSKQRIRKKSLERLQLHSKRHNQNKEKKNGDTTLTSEGALVFG